MNLQPTVMAPEYKTAPKKRSALTADGNHTAVRKANANRLGTRVAPLLRRCHDAVHPRQRHGGQDPNNSHDSHLFNERDA